MNWKVLIGFLAGAVLAATGSYWLEHRHLAPEPVAIAPVLTAAPPPSPAPAAADVTPASEPEIAPPARKPVPPAPTRKTPAAVLPPYAERVSTEIPKPAAPIPVAEPPKVAATPAPVEPPIEPNPAPEPVAAPTPVVETKLEKPEPHSVTIADGTMLRVRLGETLSTKRNHVGDTFAGTLDQELVVDGFVIAERGSRVEGRVSQSEEAGRTRGLAHLGLELTRIHTSDGQTVNIRTAKFEQLGAPSKTEDWAKVGIGTALGGAIGGAAGGGKGAAIGAAAGAAAGAGTVAATRGKPAEVAVETRISFKLEQPVMLTERLP
jgi:hypothetical protein